MGGVTGAGVSVTYQGTTPPSSPDHLLLENDDDLLLESGDLILLE
jgi:hypothetical protein